MFGLFQRKPRYTVVGVTKAKGEKDGRIVDVMLTAEDGECLQITLRGENVPEIETGQLMGLQVQP